MKCLKLAIAIALAGGLSATTALAQTGLRQPRSVQRTGFEYGSYDYYAQDGEAPSPADQAAPPAPPAAHVAAPHACAECAQAEAPSCGCEAPSCGCEAAAPSCSSCQSSCSTCNSCNSCDSCNSCSSCGHGCGCLSDCPLECEEQETCRLFDDCCCLKCNGITVEGWLSGGYTYNPEDPADGWNGIVTFNDRANEGLFDQGYIVVKKDLDEDELKCGCDWGFHVDAIWGSDFRFVLSRGLDAEDDGTAKWDSSRFYGLALPQLYAELGTGDLSVKIGRFYTPIGYETFPAPENFFYSKSLSFQYGEPLTHTGVLATYKINDQVSVVGGVHYGWDASTDQNDGISFIGGYTVTSCDEKQKVAFFLTSGEEDVIANEDPQGNRTMYSIVYTNALSDRTNYIFQHDLGIQQIDDADIDQAEWYSINQYVTYKINCCWTAGVRAEWFRDDDGYRVAPASDFVTEGSSSNPASAGGFAGDFYEISAGLNWKPNGNLTVRPELRYDWYDGPASFNNGAQPFDEGTSDSQFLAAMDLIYLY